MVNWIKKIFYNKYLMAIVSVIISIGIFVTIAYYYGKNNNKDANTKYAYEVIQQESVLSYNEYKSRLVKEVKAYIDSIAPTSSLNAYAVVQMAEKYDLDVKFVLAQGHLESHFGTSGIAAKTNSVFNVGAYDNLSADSINGRYKYKHPDFSIEPYMQLLYNEYISGSKTELDLMAKYVNKNGKRYSSSPNYEKDLFTLYTNIDKSTDITELQGEMRRYKIISGT